MRRWPERAAVLAWIAACALALPRASVAAQIEGVEFADNVQVRGVDLKLNAVGLLRYMYVIKAYVAGLYLGEGVAPAEVLADRAKRLEITYFYALSKQDFQTSTLDCIRRNVDAETFAKLLPRIERFNALYRDVQPNDRYALTYLPGVGTELALNGESLGTIEGADFGSAVFAIWFGEEEIDASLKKTLLAGR
jgi:hypothetical protein